MKTILLATDFSKYAEIAHAHARRIAAHTGASVVVAHAAIIDNARPNAFELVTGELESFRELVQTQLARRRAQLDELARSLTDAGITATADLVDGAPARAICDAAKAHGADLIVIGSHGLTGFYRLLLGSVAERVVRLAPCSVLVAREPVPDGGFERVLVPTDFAPPADHALELAVELSDDHASIDLLHSWHMLETIDSTLEPGASSVIYSSLADQILHAANERGKALIEQWRPSGRQIELTITEGRPAAAVHRFIEAQEDGYDLVAVGTHGRTGLGRLLLGSVAERTVRHSPCSVLVARAEPEEA